MLAGSSAMGAMVLARRLRLHASLARGSVSDGDSGFGGAVSVEGDSVERLSLRRF